MTSLLCPLHQSVLLHLTTPLDCYHLKMIEEHISSSSCPHPKVLKDLRFKEPIEGCSPLLLACHFGELASVKHIVESWGADLRKEAAYYTNPTSTTCWDSARIGRATPLFVASIKGHIAIVRYLIEKGADVSVKTSDVIDEKDYDGLTPLYASLWEIHDYSLPNMSKGFLKERSDIVHLLLESGASPSVKPANGWPIWMMPVCGIEALTELVNHGMVLNEGSESETGSILSYWAGGSHKISKFSFYEKDCSLKVVKYLLDKDVRLLAHRDDWGFTAIIEAAYGGNVLRTNHTVLDYLLGRDDIDEMDKIDALELAGAVVHNRDQGDRPKALKYWRQALRLRQNESNPKPKILMKFKNVRTIEWVTSDELERIIRNPFEYEIQSFLVRLRILFSRKESSRAVDTLCFSYLWADSFSKLKSQKRYDDILDILWAILETINLCNGSLSIATTVKTVMVMINTLVFLQLASPVLVSVESVKTSLDLVLPHLNDWERFNIQNYMETMLILSTFLSGQHQMLDNGKLESFFQLVRRERQDSKGRTLLFIACEDDKSIHLYATVRFLLEGKADPHLANTEGNTPLHVAASQSGELGDSITRLLLNSGAHLDRVNKCGKTAVQIWIEKNESRHRSNGDQGFIGDLMPDWSCGIVLKLSCLCAQLIRSHKIPFKTVPITLHPFIKLH